MSLESKDDVSVDLARVHELKTLGNDQFARKAYAEARETYTRAVAAASSLLPPASADVARLLAQVYANRSASSLALKDASSAVEDATRATELCPSWAKAFMRLAAALSSLSRHHAALDAYRAAYALEKGNVELRGLMEDAARAAAQASMSGEVLDVPDFIRRFASVREQPRLRLATLAAFWNASNQGERWRIFTRFLAVVAGPDAVAPLPPGTCSDDAPPTHISRFEAHKELLIPLPMHNYADVHVPPPWLAFYSSLPSGDDTVKPALFQRAWEACSRTEQGLIIQDVRAFFMPADVSGDDAGDSAVGRGEEGASEGEGSQLQDRHAARHTTATAGVLSTAPVRVSDAAHVPENAPRRLQPSAATAVHSSSSSTTLTGATAVSTAEDGTHDATAARASATSTS